MMPWHRLGAAIAVVTLTACGSGQTTTDQERVEAALLRLSDLPADEGWAAEPSAADDPAQAQLEADLDRCEQEHDPTVDVRTADRDSDDFVRGSLLVSSSASVVADETARGELFAALDEMLNCAGTALETWLSQVAPEGVRITVTEPYELDVTTEADRTAGLAVQVGIGSESFFLDAVVVEQGATLLYVLFFHQGEITLADEQDIVSHPVQRLEDLSGAD
jgi:hypothetical protein